MAVHALNRLIRQDENPWLLQHGREARGQLIQGAMADQNVIATVFEVYGNGLERGRGHVHFGVHVWRALYMALTVVPCGPSFDGTTRSAWE